MLGKIKTLLISSGITLFTMLSFTGALTSTIAWFSYSTSTPVSFHGTSIMSNKQIQVGIVTNYDLSAQNLTSELVPGTSQKIAWSQPGEGLNPRQLAAYLTKAGYASQELTPVTSRRYATGDALKLYSSPYDYRPSDLEAATNELYSKVSLAFRVINLSDGSYVKNRNIWLSDIGASGETKDTFAVSRGVRCHFSNPTTKFIVNPTAEKSGNTVVGGLLDLNNDEYYDLDDYGDEIVYGDYDGIPTRSYRADDSELDDINNTGMLAPYVFCSKHAGNSNSVDNFDDLTMKTAEYYCVEDVAPYVDEDGNFTGGKPVCKTGENYIGTTDLTIWIEGWDLSIVNQVWDLTFDLGLTFEIDKI